MALGLFFCVITTMASIAWKWFQPLKRPPWQNELGSYWAFTLTTKKPDRAEIQYILALTWTWRRAEVNCVKWWSAITPETGKVIWRRKQNPSGNSSGGISTCSFAVVSVELIPVKSDHHCLVLASEVKLLVLGVTQSLELHRSGSGRKLSPFHHQLTRYESLPGATPVHALKDPHEHHSDRSDSSAVYGWIPDFQLLVLFNYSTKKYVLNYSELLSS